MYTSNVFYVQGEWNTLEDVNTLIDVGSDPMIFSKLDSINGGLGKNKIDQVIITHNHSDHVAMLSEIYEKYKPKIYAFDPHLKHVDQALRDGDVLRIGEMYFEVFHITAHSSDSVCLYCTTNGFLFAGDTTFPLEFENRALKEENAYPISRLNGKVVTKIFYGHGDVIDFSVRKFQLTK
jgi:glyoxylase-like metal-dependent hydrolase (beta-lactamase superfamily II)